MKVSELPATLRARLSERVLDFFIEEHEGPWEWSSFLDNAEFLNAGGYDVLLPLPLENHRHIEVREVVPSVDGRTLTVFLTDSTWFEAELYTGAVAVCRRYYDEPWFVAVFYHGAYFSPRKLSWASGPLSKRCNVPALGREDPGSV